MQIKKIEIKNFFSIGNKPLIINFNNKINYVSGFNYDNNSTNGVGKTTVFIEAIIFALFGKTYKQVQKDDIINYRNKKQLSVKLYYSFNNHNYVIIRERKPNLLILIEDDKTLEFSSMKETQKYIETAISFNKELFFNLLFLSANTNISFIDNDGSIKNKILFEKIFLPNANFKVLLDKTRSLKNDIAKQLNSFIIEQEKLKTEIETIKNNLVSNKKSIKIKTKNYNNKLNDLKKIDIYKYKEIINDLKKENEKHLKAKILLKEKLIQFKTKIKTKNEYKQILDNGDNQCPVCRQEIKDNLKTSIILSFDRDIQKLISINKKIKEKIEYLDNLVFKNENRLKKINDKINQIKVKKNELEKLINENLKMLKSLKNKININEYKNKMKKIKNTIDWLKIDLSDYQIIERIFDPKQGVINYFIQKIVKIVNENIKKIIKEINFDVDFSFDEELKITFMRNSLGAFSSGELRMINFIIIFSIYNTFLKLFGKRINLLVIDEFFDSTISENKLHLFFNLLKSINKKYGIGIYLLSHKLQMAQQFDFNNIINLEKRNGFTILKDEVEN
jgi:DNA repair exonuclease SbcCD ATPase subunit